MTVTYKNRQYGHQQLWSLVAALNEDGVFVQFEMYEEEWPPEAYLIEPCCRGWIRKGNPGDRTPFRALARAVEAMQQEDE